MVIAIIVSYFIDPDLDVNDIYTDENSNIAPLSSSICTT